MAEDFKLYRVEGLIHWWIVARSAAEARTVVEGEHARLDGEEIAGVSVEHVPLSKAWGVQCRDDDGTMSNMRAAFQSWMKDFPGEAGIVACSEW